MEDLKPHDAAPASICHRTSPFSHRSRTVKTNGLPKAHRYSIHPAPTNRLSEDLIICPIRTRYQPLIVLIVLAHQATYTSSLKIRHQSVGNFLPVDAKPPQPGARLHMLAQRATSMCMGGWTRALEAAGLSKLYMPRRPHEGVMSSEATLAMRVRRRVRSIMVNSYVLYLPILFWITKGRISARDIVCSCIPRGHSTLVVATLGICYMGKYMCRPGSVYSASNHRASARTAYSYRPLSPICVLC
jgi:hypothetical protein